MIQKTPDPFATRPTGHFATLDCDTESYHRASDGISRSMLEDFIEDPGLFHGRHVLRTIPPKEPTRDMQIGSMTHECYQVLLEGADPYEALMRDVVEIPPEVLASNGAKSTKAYEKFAAEHPGKRLMKRKELEPIEQMVAALEEMRSFAHEIRFLHHALAQGEAEKSIEWRDEKTGLLLRCRLDWFCPLAILDFKTVPKIDPRSFVNSVHRGGLHRQNAFYRRGVHALTGEWPSFAFVPVRKVQPHRLACYELPDEWVQHGEEEVDRALMSLVRCRDANDWTPEYCKKAVLLPYPRFARPSDEWSLPPEE